MVISSWERDCPREGGAALFVQQGSEQQQQVTKEQTLHPWEERLPNS